jgi:hypothetical protein
MWEIPTLLFPSSRITRDSADSPVPEQGTGTVMHARVSSCPWFALTRGESCHFLTKIVLFETELIFIFLQCRAEECVEFCLHSLLHINDIIIRAKGIIRFYLRLRDWIRTPVDTKSWRKTITEIGIVWIHYSTLQYTTLLHVIWRRVLILLQFCKNSVENASHSRWGTLVCAISVDSAKQHSK